MPKVRKLTDEEIARLLRPRARRQGPSRREMIRQQYRQYLEDLQPGDWVAVELEEGERKLTVRNRLKRAAADLGLALEFRRARGPIIYFRVK
ncbi:MAG: hypothetical protein ONB23_09930 [candidate division KSB1 bacterium]|nr:hypothetical protein [candidate division KSB1 bacterium]